MKYSISSLLLILLIAAAGCGTSQEALNERFPNLVEVNPPDRIPYEEREIVIDTVEIVQIKRAQAIHVTGSFPNPCTQILRIEDDNTLGTLNLSFIGWQKFRETCQQSTAPFSFLYRSITKEEIEDIDTIIANGKTFDLNTAANDK